MTLAKYEFDQLMQSVTMALSQRDLAQALVLKDRVIREGTAEMKGQCLLFVGMIQESYGDLRAAQQEWFDALGYADSGTFLRYSLEVQVGSTWETLGEVDLAMTWYRRALQTCAEGAEFSGNRALAAILKLKGTIAAEDQTVARAVIEKSWRVLEVPGSPDSERLKETIGILSDWFSSSVSKIKDAG